MHKSVDNPVDKFPMHRLREPSSSIARYGFVLNDPPGCPACGVLALEFASGATWWYREVPVSVLEAWLLSDSRGRFFREQIRDRYPGVPVKLAPK